MLRFAQAYQRDFSLPILVGNNKFVCWHAADYVSRNLGLMGHRLQPKTGCLLDFQQPCEVGLWMKNCLHPLVAVFATPEGKIVHTALMKETEPTTIHRCPVPCQFALEILPNDAQGINVGDYLQVEQGGCHA